MKVKINKSKCLGCGACANICPEGIKMIDNLATVKNDNAECINEAIKICPINIITIN